MVTAPSKKDNNKVSVGREGEEESVGARMVRRKQRLEHTKLRRTKAVWLTVRKYVLLSIISEVE